MSTPGPNWGINITDGTTQQVLALLNTAVESNTQAIGEIWFVLAGALVFFMQAGFAMLEAGSVRSKSTINILFKNLLDSGIGAISFWLIGWGLAFGSSESAFAGENQFALNDDTFTNTATSSLASSSYASWFFQFTFAATAATIVSGAVAERTQIFAYLTYSVLLTAIVYPIVVYWGWNGGFNASWTKDGREFGMHDFAGSGIVHLVGGTAGLIGTMMLGPRIGRFTDKGPVEIPGHSATLQSLGTTILWFGWYGFNCGSGSPAIAGKVATITTIGAAAACITGTVVVRLMSGTYRIEAGLNCALSGLVSITAGANILEPWGAAMAGFMAALIFIGTSKLLVRLRIDDPLDAFAVHGANGFWGLLVCGIFATKAGVIYSGSDESGYDCSDKGGCPIVFAANLSFGLAVIAWTASTSLVIFGLLKLVGKLRVPESEELEGLDSSEHGAKAYYIDSVQIPQKMIPSIPEGSDGSSDIESGEPVKLNALNSPTSAEAQKTTTI